MLYNLCLILYDKTMLFNATNNYYPFHIIIYMKNIF